VLYDQINNYLYDPEGRLCAVSYFNGTTTEYMLYLYDGEGRRVAKVSNPTFSCTPGTGSTLMETYLLGPSGEHITELGQTGAFLRSNVYANGRLLATYTNDGTYFSLSDWLGSKRVVTKYDGTVAQMCMNLPFGDELMCSATDLSEHHFTGQIHDQESGNDYFNARYYSNYTGRFMSPDPAGLEYADPSHPQSLNLYSYAQNNPLTNTDPTGMYCDYSDHSDPSSGFDSSQFDFHSSSSECAQNGGQFVNDAYTHQDASGNSVDDDGRPNVAVSSITDGTNVQLTGQFKVNMTMLEFTTVMQQSDFYVSDLDQMLADKKISGHTGIQMRQDKTGCNLHVSIDANSGQNGQPVTGTYHKDIFNPNPNSNPADAIITLPFHAAEAALDKQRTRDKIPGTIGDQFCP
jgi:RHS repeat-associated protein